jgi:transposase
MIPMLLPYQEPKLSFQDEKVFDSLVPYDHWTRRADKFIDFLKLRESIQSHFGDSGRPAVEPIMLIKMELLMFHECLSDSQLMERCKTDLAFRRFLRLGLNDTLPDVSTLRKFRARIGAEGHGKLFHALLTQSREYGLVKDRLRLKDATHVLADIAIPAGLQLVAQARNKLLNAAERFERVQVEGERVRSETIRLATDGKGNEERLIARVEHLRDILAWVEKIESSKGQEAGSQWLSLRAAIEIARKVLHGHDDPKAPKKIRSTVDPDARRGRHGEFYDGYFVDVLVDADSELFTAINVLAAGESESADAVLLLEQEQSYHGNQVEKMSIDGAGYDGPVIRQLESSDGGAVEVFIPPRDKTNRGKFTSDEFKLNEDGMSVTCPQGEQSRTKQSMPARHTTSFKFADETCNTCPLKSQCIDLDQKNGRTVKKGDYEAEYQKVEERARTEEYAKIKREHPKVERRLGELINRHDGRRARYRGLPRVLAQKFLEATTANLKRMLRLLDVNYAI